MKNKQGGKKTKKQKRDTDKEGNSSLVIPNKDEGTYLARIVKILGNLRAKVKTEDEDENENKYEYEYIGKICGSIRKKFYFLKGDYVMISIRDFETNNNKCDILWKYNTKQQKILCKYYGFNDIKIDHDIILEDNINSDEVFFEYNNKNDDLNDDTINNI